MMKFKFVYLNTLRESLSNFFMNYKKSYLELNSSLLSFIPEDRFNNFKKRPITSDEIRQLIEKNTKFTDKGVILKVKDIWEQNENEILSRYVFRGSLWYE